MYHCNDIVNYVQETKMILYHGSVTIIEKPIYHGGKATNDYGYGFYCTENIDLAKEWACTNNETNGYANKYELDLDKLNVLDLTSKEYSVLNWIAILLKFRQFDISSDILMAAKEYLLKNFYIDVNKYDVVIGYRADDSYFRFARDFISNTISVEKLAKAMELGMLGKQIVLISEKAHKEIKYISTETADHTIFYTRRVARDKKAREDYLKSSKDVLSGLYIKEIMIKGLKNGDKII